ncbi:MAG: ATP synthase F1 subunit gamma [Thermotogae bacterium]|nr:ATP synthase F1 subunit gamma [Thermotogota bacterium]
MEMVATARLQLFKKNLKNFYEYEKEFSSTFERISSSIEDIDEVKNFIWQETPSNVMIVVIAGDMGLCGSYNDDIVNASYDREKTLGKAFNSFYVIGSKVNKRMGFDGKKIRNSIIDMYSKPFYDDAQSLSNELIRIYGKGEIDCIEIIHGYSKSSLIQSVKDEIFLPIKIDKKSQNISYDFEPSAEEMLKVIMPQYFGSKMYRILLESRISEQNARQNAMRNATENAKKLMDDFSLKYNKMRQFYITQEVIEITNSSESLKGEESTTHHL